ncbi:MAG: Uncharacterised protein [Marinobacterium sp. xm-d-530]|nr:MAG: Uncharacterised protein [Marinobacterium sp. xm-d-530]
MKFIKCETGEMRLLPKLFETTFAASESSEEGRLIGKLVDDLLNMPEDESIHVYAAVDEELVLGAVLFTDLSYSDDLSGFLLSPMAVLPEYQGQGIGQRLIQSAVDDLAPSGKSFVVTYGDPNFYSKVGFECLSEKQLAAPYKLSMPQGWQILSLVPELPVSECIPTCAPPFRNANIW